jgi:hypothetical protein
MKQKHQQPRQRNDDDNDELLRPNPRYLFNKQPSHKTRLYERRGLVQYLLGEIQHGSSVTRLYASLLAKTLLAEEPELRQRYPNILAADKPKVSIPRVRSQRAMRAND